MKKIRVLIIEDSLVIRELLRHVIAQDPRLEVAAAVGSAEEGLRLLHRIAPDVISMDIRLPGMNGFEATQRIMRERPTPIVVVSASVESEDLNVTMNALRAGALSVVEKPAGRMHRDYERLAETLCTRLAIMSEVKVVRQRVRPPAPATPARLEARALGSHPFRVVGIVSSTGGPGALAQLLPALGADFPLPILLVQHITATFLEGFARWLGSVAPAPVAIASDGEKPLSGRIYVAPPDRHLVLRAGRLRLEQGEPVSGQLPSGSVLFDSLAKELGPQAVGVVLTGMGEDGASGLLALREAGGYTLVEDASTAVVFGMPAAALAIGAVPEALPLPAIAARLRELAAAGLRVS